MLHFPDTGTKYKSPLLLVTQRVIANFETAEASGVKVKPSPSLRIARLVNGLTAGFLLCCLPLIVALTGCGSNASVDGSQAPPPTVSISATPNSITAGASAVLSIAATSASRISVTGTDGTSFTLGATGGTKTITPTSTATYTATATGVGGTSTAATIVTVGAPPAATVTINANPVSITAGGTSTLTVAATNATQVTVTGTDGSSFALGASGGTKTVSPTATTTYTATATGAGASATATAVVTVTTAVVGPTVTIGANPASITTGASSVLTVAATNATQVTITGSDGSSYSLSATGGTKTVSPTATTTYTATATGTGTATAMTTVTVTAAAPTVTIGANPASITTGASSVLTVSATNATQVTITGSDGSSYSLSATGGTKTVSPTATTTYTATATGAGTATATAMTTVTVTAAAAPTVTISANPASVNAGSSSVLTVVATNATQVTVAGTDGSSYSLSSTGGTITVTPGTTTTYTATATGTGPNASATTRVTVVPASAPTVTIAANPTSITAGNSSTLTVTATNATQVSISGSDGTNYTLSATGGSQSVSPSASTTYTATATGAGGTITATATVTVTPPGSIQSVDHVIFMLQENHSFDNYLGMLNQYKQTNGWVNGADGNPYYVDGIDDKLTTISNDSDQGTSYSPFKLTSTCVDDMTSSWLESYGDVNRYDFSTTRHIKMDGFVHTAENYAINCNAAGGSACAGTFTDFTGQRAMGYYDQGFLNYYYYMAAQFAVSDRWFSPLSSKSIPNRIATFTGGTTQGLAFDPGSDDKLPQLDIPTIFRELSGANVSWKIYYTVTQGSCVSEDDCGGGTASYPATDFSYLTDSYQYLYENPSKAACVAPTVASSTVGDSSNSFCIDPTHIAPLSQYYTDLANGTLPSFSFVEAGYGTNDEHPGSGQSILAGQQEVAKVVNSLMTSSSWKDSVFFLAYDEGGGPYDHVPPVSGHSNDNTDTTGSEALTGVPDIAAISVNADGDNNYYPCLPSGGTPTLHCDLHPSNPGTAATDAPAVEGFAAQLGFRVPNLVISPFTRQHFVSHIPMDHTAILKFVESRFISPSAHLTARDAAQPNLLNFFDFTNVPWATPPTPPTPVSGASLGYNSCTPASFQ
jgi:phospholipase C